MKIYIKTITLMFLLFVSSISLTKAQTSAKKQTSNKSAQKEETDSIVVAEGTQQSTTVVSKKLSGFKIMLPEKTYTEYTIYLVAASGTVSLTFGNCPNNSKNCFSLTGKNVTQDIFLNFKNGDLYVGDSLLLHNFKQQNMKVEIYGQKASKLQIFCDTLTYSQQPLDVIKRPHTANDFYCTGQTCQSCCNNHKDSVPQTVELNKLIIIPRDFGGKGKFRSKDTLRITVKDGRYILSRLIVNSYNMTIDNSKVKPVQDNKTIGVFGNMRVSSQQKPDTIKMDKDALLFTVDSSKLMLNGAKVDTIIFSNGFQTCQKKINVSKANIPCQPCNKAGTVGSHNDCNVDSICSPFNYFYKLPAGAMQANAVTPLYQVIYDLRGGGPWGNPVILKFKKDGNTGLYEYAKVKKWISPRAHSSILFTIIGKKDSTYVIDTATSQFYLEHEQKFAGQFTDQSSQATGKDTSNSAKKTGASSPSAKAPATDNSKPTNKETAKKTANNVIKKLASLTSYDSLGKAIKAAKSLRVLSEIPAIKDFFSDTSLYEDVSQAKILFDSAIKIKARKAKDTTNANDSIRNLFAKTLIKSTQLTSKADSVSAALKGNLLSLLEALAMFNHDFVKASLIHDDDYRNALVCLEKNINEILGIPTPYNSDEFADVLVDLVNRTVDVHYKGEFCSIINDIKAEYFYAFHRWSSFRVFNKQISVPNVDEFDIKLHTLKSKDPILMMSFDVSTGMKIDFSTGFVLSGISNIPYTVSPTTFRVAGRPYKNPVDTTTHDTSFNYVHKGKAPMNFGLGFFAHIYPRTGHAVNVGLVSGLLINNNASTQFILGLSTMFNAGNNRRFSIMGGASVGQVQTLSETAKQYLYNSQYATYTKFSSIYQVPVPYSASSLSANDLVTRWVVRYFVGMTYNFATINTGRK